MFVLGGTCSDNLTIFSNAVFINCWVKGILGGDDNRNDLNFSSLDISISGTWLLKPSAIYIF